MDFCDHRLPDEAKPRLSRQCRLILDRLRQGRVSNDELSRMARKYTSRLSDARKAGFDIRVVSQNHTTGLAFYALFEDGAEIGASAMDPEDDDTEEADEAPEAPEEPKQGTLFPEPEEYPS